ncbi:unnamed protein product [Orchesella dallaii]|uniref:TFIID subunit TAF5 NTD2 domain-containing protein n=1 Tax=Orchesella dallaii TaxID=48710 RepID=A0ABP1S1C3_9HEXA
MDSSSGGGSNNYPTVTVANDSVITSVVGTPSQQQSPVMNNSQPATTPPPSLTIGGGMMPMEVDTHNVNHTSSTGQGGQHHQFPPGPQQNTQQSPNSSLQNGENSSSLGGSGSGAGGSAELASKMNGNAGTHMTEAEKNALMVVLSFLKKHNLKDTEESLKKEAHIAETDIRGSLPMDSDVHTVLSSYANDENPDEYTDAYNQLKNFIDTSLDAYKYEVGQILWPVFVHMYLELVYNEHESQANSFFLRFSKMQETFHETDLISLGSIMKKEHLVHSENPFRSLAGGLYSSGKPGSPTSGLYVVRMSREAQSLLKRFLQEKRLKLVQNIVQDRIHIEVYDGIPRGKAAIHAVAGHLMGEALKQDNKAKVYYGLLREPDLQNVQMDEDDEEGGAAAGTSTSTGGNTSESQSAPSTQPSTSQSGAKTDPQSNAQGTPGGGEKSSKKKKSKKDWLLSKKGKNDPNAPPITRMPLPELRDVDKIEKAKALREAAKRVTLGPDKMPSVCFYTILNGDHQVTYVKWSEDGTLMAIGFASSLIKVWTMTPAKLRKLKPASDLAEIDREADDVLVRMMDDHSAEPNRCLRGHSGPVYSLDFAPDKAYLLSSSEDCSIRLWSLLTWTCLVVYKGHLFPVWKAVFSPHGGYYFASAGYDCTARLWATDSYTALRVFAGHYSDVTAILFHPNSNYIATGSSDRSVRLWDCVSGSCVRLMTGHKGTIHALHFSADGRFLVSSAADSKVLVWDLANGNLLTCLNMHKSTVYSLSFSREGSVLATGGLDYCVRLWDFMKMIEDVVTEEGGATIPPDVKKISADGLLIGEFYTKATPIYSLHFTRRNILLASGPFIY